MSRRTSGAILCPSCGRLTTASAEACFFCGRRRPGAWSLGASLRRLGSSVDVTGTIIVISAALYVLSLALDLDQALQVRGPFEVLSPSVRALNDLGMTGAVPWHQGRWWTLVTAIYLHGGLLHILFNVLWVRQLGPAVETVYGPARLAIIFTTSGVAGFLLSNVQGSPFTVGASGAIFGLLGALVAYGRERGGAFGAMVFRQYGQWALILFIFGFFLSGVDNWAHAGGFVGGLVCGLLLSSTERRPESAADRVLGLGVVLLTLTCFALAVAQGIGSMFVAAR